MAELEKVADDADRYAEASAGPAPEAEFSKMERETDTVSAAASGAAIGAVAGFAIPFVGGLIGSILGGLTGLGLGLASHARQHDHAAGSADAA